MDEPNLFVIRGTGDPDYDGTWWDLGLVAPTFRLRHGGRPLNATGEFVTGGDGEIAEILRPALLDQRGIR